MWTNFIKSYPKTDPHLFALLFKRNEVTVFVLNNSFIKNSFVC